MDPDFKKGNTPNYAIYQREQFRRGAEGRGPAPVSAHPVTAQHQAREKLADRPYWYAASNAGLGWTDQANRQAFADWRLVPKMLVDTRNRDLSVTVLGHTLPAPIIAAPIGLNKNYDPQGEVIPARVFGELGLGYALSTAATRSIEDVAKANGAGIRFFQLYLGDDDEITLSLLKRAYDNGFTALMVTVDTWQLAWRPTDADRSNYSFYYPGGVGNEMGESDPVFKRKYGEALERDSSIWADKHVWHGKSHSWPKMGWVREQWKRISGGLPFGIKGIQRVDDAERCVQLGCDFIAVSNHAGRQLDGAIGSLEALPDIAAAVGDKLEILFDSGIRTGPDIIKAIALGAKAVMIGRNWVFPLSAGGYEGCKHAVRSLLAELDIACNVAGYPVLRDVKAADILRRSSSNSGIKL